MEITRESLQQRFSDLADAELLRRARSGALTELAREVALTELAERGISPDAVGNADPATAVDDQLEFSPDEFERNPYQAPRTAETAQGVSPTHTPRLRLWNTLWWIYIGYLCVLILSGMAQYLRHDELTAINLIHAVLTSVGATGLAAWRLRRRLIHPMVWITCLAVGLAFLATSIKTLVNLLSAVAHEHNSTFTYVALALILLNLPLFWGLARYALLSPTIWRRPERP